MKGGVRPGLPTGRTSPVAVGETNGPVAPGVAGPDGPDAHPETSAARAKPAAASRTRRLAPARVALDDPARFMTKSPLPPRSRDGPDAPDPILGPAGSPSLEAGLYVVSTPIGNLRDVTLRALDVLAGVDLVLAEDTRVTRKLLNAFGIEVRVERCDEHAVAAIAPRIVAQLKEGGRIALVSDAGTPLVSDPGDRIVRAAIDSGVRIVPIPGASAVLAALVASGLAGGPFTFAGFAPPKTKARKDFFASLADAPGALVLFETGPRLAESLADMAATLGPRQAAVARELTKMFETVTRGALDQLAAAFAVAYPPRGEIVVIVEPAPPPDAADSDDIDAALRRALADQPLKTAVAAVASALDAPRRVVYARALALKGGAAEDA
jgi:16S rRNA (cytidine1402-2'-O)-methyltransferase